MFAERLKQRYLAIGLCLCPYRFLGKQAVHHAVHIGTYNMYRSVQQSAFEKEVFEVLCPNLAVEVVTNALAQNGTKGDSAALVVKAFAHRYFA